MELINFNEFMRRTLGGVPPGTTVNPAPYVGHTFECACGQYHRFDVALWIRELTGMRMVHKCPATDSITCIKTTGVFRFKGFRSLFGVRGYSQKERSEATLQLAEEVLEKCLEYWELDFFTPNDRLLALILDAPMNEEAKAASRRFFETERVETVAEMAKAAWIILVETDSSADTSLLKRMRSQAFERIDQKASGIAS